MWELSELTYWECLKEKKILNVVLAPVKYILSTQPGWEEIAEYGVRAWEMKDKRMERKNIKIFSKGQISLPLITGQTLVYWYLRALKKHISDSKMKNPWLEGTDGSCQEWKRESSWAFSLMRQVCLQHKVFDFRLIY